MSHTDYHCLSSAEVLERFDVDPDRGLSDAEARRRLDQNGPNKLREAKRRSGWGVLLD